MKLLTLIPPKRGGTVTLREGKAVYVFEPAADGQLVADVDDEALVARLLASSNFEPADSADFEKADELVQAMQEKGDEKGDEDGDEDGDENALPVEAKTPPVVGAKRRGR